MNHGHGNLSDQYSLFCGNACVPLAQEVSKRLGLPLGDVEISRFSDGEINLEIAESVRGQQVFVLQSTCAPAHDTLMELLLLIDALKRSFAECVIAVIPYFGYSRQDRRPGTSRVAISAKLVAGTIGLAGADSVVCMDLHADQIQGFFDIPTEQIYATPVFTAYVYQHLSRNNTVVVSPDIGGVLRARAFAKSLDVDLAVIDKRRPAPNQTSVMNVIGNVNGMDCILIDDIVDTGNTLCAAAVALKEKGALSVRALCTHPVLSGHAVDLINRSELDKLVVSDTIPLQPEAAQSPNIEQISVAELLAESLRRIAMSDSVSSLFTD